jgi:hypothetical protein
MMEDPGGIEARAAWHSDGRVTPNIFRSNVPYFQAFLASDRTLRILFGALHLVRRRQRYRFGFWSR